MVVGLHSATQIQGRCKRLTVWNALRHQSPRLGFLCCEDAAGREQLDGTTLRKSRDDTMRRDPGKDAESNLGKGKRRGGFGHPQVARKSQFVPAAPCLPVDGSDRHEWTPVERPQDPYPGVAIAGRGPTVGHRHEVFEVCMPNEDVIGPGDDDESLMISGRCGQQSVQFGDITVPDHPRARTIKRQDADIFKPGA